MTNLISKYFKKILLINAILTHIHTLHADTNKNIHFYVNDIEIYQEEISKRKNATTYERSKIMFNVGDEINVESIKTKLLNLIKATYSGGEYKDRKINSIEESEIKDTELVFVVATKDEHSGIINVPKTKTIKVEKEAIHFHYLTQRRINAIKRLKIETININGEKIDIGKHKQNLNFLENIDMINDSIIKYKIIEKIEELNEYKNNVKKQGVNSYSGSEVIFDGGDYYTMDHIIKYAENFEKISIKLSLKYSETYKVEYEKPEGTEFRENSIKNGSHIFNNDNFGESYASFPTSITCNYKNKEEAQENRKKEIAKQIKSSCYSEFETEEYNFNKLDNDIHQKEEEFLKKINNGDNIKPQGGKNWKSLKENDTIKVELTEKSEFIKSVIVPVKINPPEGHQLAGILGVNNTVNVTVSGINDINNKDAIKNALKNKLSEMRIDVNGKRLEIPQETIETITSNITIGNEGLTKTCEGQIPIGAGDFIATEQEIKQREQKKQNKNKKPQQIGMSEGTARCCACCSKCCKGECCKEGCCKRE